MAIKKPESLGTLTVNEVSERLTAGLWGAICGMRARGLSEEEIQRRVNGLVDALWSQLGRSPTPPREEKL